MGESNDFFFFRIRPSLVIILLTFSFVCTILNLQLVFQLKELISQGYSVITRDNTGQTVLHYAARHGHKDLVKYILETAPSFLLNMKDTVQGQTPLHKAATYRWRSICCMLVAAGADLKATDARGLTPRLLALQSEDYELAAYLESKYFLNKIRY